MYKFFQNLGRSLMLPVAILPAAAIIAGIGNTLNALHATPKIAMFFTTVGTTILEQLGILFAIGVAIGMAKKNDACRACSYVRIFFSYSCIITNEISAFIRNESFGNKFSF